MILVDTSVWVEHLRRGEPRLVDLLDAGQVLGHPLVVGELAMGNLAQRDLVLAMLGNLPQAVVAQDGEVMGVITLEKLHGLGIGYVDACLLVATLLSPDARLWTRDRRLADIAARMDVAISG